MGRYRQQFTNHTFNETMGVHDSYRETLTSWEITTKETKVIMGGIKHIFVQIHQIAKFAQM